VLRTERSLKKNETKDFMGARLYEESTVLTGNEWTLVRGLQGLQGLRSNAVLRTEHLLEKDKYGAKHYRFDSISIERSATHCMFARDWVVEKMDLARDNADDANRQWQSA
jgi:hypothetical protein